MVEWLPGFERITGEDSGTWAPDNEDAPKIVLHTTEGRTVNDAVSAFRQHRSWPHLTVDPVQRRKCQHVSLNRAARALRNTSTPGQTNREARVWQIEIVGTAHDPDRAPRGQTSVASFTPEQLDWLGTEVLRPLAAATGCPLVTSVTFYGERCGWTLASVNARQRLSAAAWDTYVGVLAHQHVPENDHWDVGPLDVARILTAAGGTHPPTPGGPFMALTDKEQRELLDTVRALAKDVPAIALRVQELDQQLTDGADPSKGGISRRLLRAAAETEAAVGRIEDAVTGKP